MPEDLKIHTEYELVAISAEAVLPISNIDGFKWVAAAREGQVIALQGGLGVITRESLEGSIGSWNGKDIIEDHKTIKAGFTIHGEKFVSPFLYFLLDSLTIEELKKGAGGSIDALATEIKESKVLGMSGVGYSILPPGRMPSCTKESGCGVPIAGAVKLADINAKWDFNKADYTLEQLEAACAWKDTTKSKAERTKEDYKLAYKLPDGRIVWRGVHAAMGALNGARQDVNIPTKDRETIYNLLSAAYKLFDKEPPELKQKIKGELEEKGGSKREMAEKTPEVNPEVTFSAKQVAEIKAAAVAEVTEQLSNAHKAGVADMEATKAAELKTLGETHATELETQRELVTKQVGLIESLSAQYSLSDEAKKTLTDAKTLEDALALFAGLKITKPIAGEGAAGKSGKDGDNVDKGGGVVQGGAAVEGQAPKTVKIEEVGSWNAYTQKFEPSFREELI